MCESDRTRFSGREEGGRVVGTSRLGFISSSNFYVPQVNLPGSMASFVMPAGSRFRWLRR